MIAVAPSYPWCIPHCRRPRLRIGFFAQVSLDAGQSFGDALVSFDLPIPIALARVGDELPAGSQGLGPNRAMATFC
jgi:hypothetical protein